MLRNLKITLALAAGLLLAACGGGDDAAPVAEAPAEVPASATASTTAFVSYAVALPPSETMEPLDVTRLLPPTSETEEPMEVD